MRSTSCQAAVEISSTLRSITGEPSNRSGYSSRSVSKARICWMRSDSCWSQGRGRPSASFHAGSWSERVRAPFDRVTPSVSRTIRAMLFSGCASVSPSELTCTPYRKRRILGSSTPYRSRPRRSQSALNARSLQVSSMKRIPALQKNEIRPKTAGKRRFGTLTPSRMAIALASANAISCTGVAPTSCR